MAGSFFGSGRVFPRHKLGSLFVYEIGILIDTSTSLSPLLLSSFLLFAHACAELLHTAFWFLLLLLRSGSKIAKEMPKGEK